MSNVQRTYFGPWIGSGGIRSGKLEFFDEHRPLPGLTITADPAAPELPAEIRTIAAIPER